MKLAVVLSASAVALMTSSRGAAVETRRDVETDHIDAADDGGPRTAGVLLHPLSMAARWLGVEVDVAFTENVVVSIGADDRRLFGATGDRVTLGLALYPQRFSFHGIYVHPVAMWRREAVEGVSSRVFGAGVTVGYAWTWPGGPTVRLGGGVAYAPGPVGEDEATLALGRLRSRIDGDVGWVF